MTPEIPYHFARFIRDYGKSTYGGMILTGKLRRHGYAQ